MCAATRPLAIAITLVTVFAVSAFAADTGTVSGAVFDQNGQPVADAAVKISGEPLPIGRTAQTGANGLYQFQYLTPGEYVVEIEKTGVGRATRVAIVEVGRDTQVDFILGLTLQEEVTVNAATPDRRRSIGRGRIQLQGRHAQQPSPRAHLPRPVPADSRRRRQPQPHRPGRGRKPAGQHCT